MTVSLHNRRKLQHAMDRLLEGSVAGPAGKLTWKNVAATAGVSKATADRAVDLRAEFRRQLQQATPPPTGPPNPGRRARGVVDEELARLRRENTELKQATKVLRNVILAMVADDQRLNRRRTRGHAILPIATNESPPVSES